MGPGKRRRRRRPSAVRRVLANAAGALRSREPAGQRQRFEAAVVAENAGAPTAAVPGLRGQEDT